MKLIKQLKAKQKLYAMRSTININGSIDYARLVKILELKDDWVDEMYFDEFEQIIQVRIHDLTKVLYGDK